MDSVAAFNVFVQVAEARSFVGAGRMLGVSASAVGKSIVRLEERLGVRLFNRSTRSVTLTAEGRLFLERSRRILAEIENAERELSQSSAAPRGRLRIGLPLVAEPFLPVLARFKKAYPEVELDLDFSDRRVDVIDEGFDAVIRTGTTVDSGLTTRRLAGLTMMLVASPDYLSQRGVPRSLVDLRDHDCIQFRYPNTGKLQAWPAAGDDLPADFQIPTSIVCNNLGARVRFALEGLGIAYLPDFAINDNLSNGSLVHVLKDYPGAIDSFQVLWPSGRYPAPKVRAFIDFLVANLFPVQVFRVGPPAYSYTGVERRIDP